MDKNENLFKKWMFEADGDPPDMDSPEIPDGAEADEGPPDIPDDISDSPSDDSFSTDGLEDMDTGYDDTGNENEKDSNENLNLSDKVSAILNNQLYQRFLALLNNVGSQLSAINKNGDVLNTLLGDYYTELVQSLKKLEENIRLYLDNTFINEDYNKNLLFFNMCLNLLKLLNDSFKDETKKGIKKID